MSFACLIIITVINCISVQFSSVRSFVGSPRSPLGLLHTFFTPVSFLVTGSTLISAAVCCSSVFCRWDWNVVLCSLVALSMPSTAEIDRDTGDRRSRCCCRRLRCRRRRRRWAEPRRDEERKRERERKTCEKFAAAAGEGSAACVSCSPVCCLYVCVCMCVCVYFVWLCLHVALTQPRSAAKCQSEPGEQPCDLKLGSARFKFKDVMQ